MRNSAVIGLIAFLGSCQSPQGLDSSKPYTVALTYVADCPLSVRSSGAWMAISSSLPIDSFERWLFVGQSDRALSSLMNQSADRIIFAIDSARELGFTHYPMVQVWKGSAAAGQLLYRGPIDNIALATGQLRRQADTPYLQRFLTRLRNGESPTFEEYPVFGCYIEP